MKYEKWQRRKQEKKLEKKTQIYIINTETLNVEP